MEGTTGWDLTLKRGKGGESEQIVKQSLCKRMKIAATAIVVITIGGIKAWISSPAQPEAKHSTTLGDRCPSWRMALCRTRRSTGRTCSEHMARTKPVGLGQVRITSRSEFISTAKSIVKSTI